MSVFDNAEIRARLTAAFPLLFVNRQNELIIHPKRNTYFRLDGVESELDLKAKILEWCSREASKSIYARSQQYHLNGINSFLGTDFTPEEMYEIYTYLGNACNHEKTLRFIESGYDLSALTEHTGRNCFNCAWGGKEDEEFGSALVGHCWLHNGEAGFIQPPKETGCESWKSGEGEA